MLTEVDNKHFSERLYYASGVPMAQSWGKDRQPYLYNGQRVLQSAQTDIDVSALPQGMYILRAETADGNAHQTKLIKQQYNVHNP